ncbi:thioredoxin-like protein [Amycolatopsis mediterranei S699]|uniref:Thioredoxin-like protein n=2 Tax=Amycolatopsis mediterranei TaxID=33910 RepID=A0A0H3D4G1_AMYMU|nr:NifU family protein [Amycolatopsis mediterranei]ADJ45561.1 thioredoxin-like protein [Amycolatopsis mediterranei U32]AEK42337.1 thioredoxin-like protein [Amycolatopsis mediterranei S699]AFO77273.1 thioredoxin-like protein [Amycolatopsis mediterranei S699]AGT84401.1 thioredoxin-like protein [Amycolatopsis mediterranei RB]KDO05819.1 thioredoxin [Amycolatopsis mediterranei]
MNVPGDPAVPSPGERLETLLAILLAGPGRRPAEEIVRQLTDLYGEGLTRIVGTLREHAPALVGAIAADDVVASLLALHDLHPLDAQARVRRALDRIRPQVGAVGYLGIDDGVVRLSLGASRGCSSAARTARATVEAAVRDAAPEVSGVEIVAEAVPALYQIGMGPPGAPEGRAS